MNEPLSLDAMRETWQLLQQASPRGYAVYRVDRETFDAARAQEQRYITIDGLKIPVVLDEAQPPNTVTFRYRSPFSDMCFVLVCNE